MDDASYRLTAFDKDWTLDVKRNKYVCWQTFLFTESDSWNKLVGGRRKVIDFVILFSCYQQDLWLQDRWNLLVYSCICSLVVISFVLHFIPYVVVWLAYFIILHYIISIYFFVFSFHSLTVHYVLMCGYESCISICQYITLFCFSFRELIPSSFAVRTFENDGSEVIQEVDISYRTY